MKKRSRHGRPRKPGKVPAGPLPQGKLPPHILEACLRDAVLEDPSVLQGARVGTDAAILSAAQSDMLVVASDPITFTEIELGPHLLAVNINDVVTTGAYPRWLALTLLLPEGTKEEDVKGLFHSVGQACRDFEIVLVGGHTEITDAVSRPVAVGTLLGLLKKDRRVDPSRTRPGDKILAIGPIAIEGTALLARERKEEVIRTFGAQFQADVENLLVDPGICVRDAALLAAGRYLTNALHDPTEGGVATALRELAAQTGWGVHIDRAAVEVLAATRLLCNHFEINPFGLLASGSLLAVLPEDEALRLSAALENYLQLSSNVIGHLTEEKRCTWTLEDGQEAAIPEFPRDEIVRVLERK